MDIKNFITRFKNVKKVGEDEYTAICPAHDDKNPSLSIGLSKDKNQILVHCFAGCRTEDVLNSVELQFKDLYLETNRKSDEIATTTYIYKKADGSLAYEKTRIDYADGSKKFYFKQPDGTKTLKGIQRELYNLPAVINASKIYFVEGEKCADAVIKQGAVATTLDTGAKSPWDEHYNSYLQDKEVVIIPDNDDPGMDYAKRLLQNIPNAKIVKLPNLPQKADIYDWLKMGHTMSEIDELPYYDVLEMNEEHGTDTTVRFDEPNRKETQAETIIRLVEERGAVLFHDSSNDPYVSISVNGHNEVWSIDSNDFFVWLTGIYYSAVKKPAKKESVTQAITVFNARARFDNPNAKKLDTRVAKDNNAFWYSLSNENWQAVKITANNWEIVDNPPILFKRYRHQKAQFQPQKNGDVRRILKYINMQNNQTLFLCWLVCCFIPDIPHAMPIFYGEKGAAKTTACTLLKKIIDPSELETLTIQKNPRSLALNLQQHWFLPFDNVSHINEETSDSLCRAITGGGIQQRKLFTDADDYIFTFQKCLAINGINNVANRSDLLDRAILIELTRIDESKRRELSELNVEFETDLPYILGGVFDILSKAMGIYPTVKLDKLPRMADFARWGYAIGEALGGLGNEFLDEYLNNQERRNVEILNSDIVAATVIAFMKDKAGWTGMVSELHNLLLVMTSHGMNKYPKDFPQQAHVLSRSLNGLKSNLREAGISFSTTVKSQGTYITITNENYAPLPPYEYKTDTKNTEEDDPDTEEVIF